MTISMIDLVSLWLTTGFVSRSNWLWLLPFLGYILALFLGISSNVLRNKIISTLPTLSLLEQSENLSIGGSLPYRQ